MNPNSSQYPPEYRADIDTLPPALRRLLDDELAAGNVIMEVGHHHPAAPAGVFVMLAEPVTTHPRESTDAVRFCQHNTSQYSGEFYDPDRHFFVLEAPFPPPEPPDMDAIRAAANVEYQPDRDGYPDTIEIWNLGTGRLRRRWIRENSWFDRPAGPFRSRVVSAQMDSAGLLWTLISSHNPIGKRAPGPG